MKSQAVIGLGFGDEGKGLTTNYLCLLNPKALVVRYSGGQQAGHTVVLDGKRHVFSNFGSGSLNGNSTYWSKYCTVDPFGIYNEMQLLLKAGITPTLYIDAKCPITTPLDKNYNQMSIGEDMRNGTCGVGVGTTLAREEKFHSILFQDLFFPSVLDIKLDLLAKNYYPNRLRVQEQIDVFKHCVNYIVNCPTIHISGGFPQNFKNVIFEGSQGLLLDQHYGFFPHVTRSNTGSTNIREMLFCPEIWCITRAYQTRHGNGPMTNQDIKHKIELNPLETNVFNNFQGEFKVSLLDLDLLEYGIKKDNFISLNKHNLVITCLDQIQNDLRFTYKGQIIQSLNELEFVNKINAILGFQNVYISTYDESHLITKI